MDEGRAGAYSFPTRLWFGAERQDKKSLAGKGTRSNFSNGDAPAAARSGLEPAGVGPVVQPLDVVGTSRENPSRAGHAHSCAVLTRMEGLMFDPLKVRFTAQGVPARGMGQSPIKARAHPIRKGRLSRAWGRSVAASFPAGRGKWS